MMRRPIQGGRQARGKAESQPFSAKRLANPGWVLSQPSRYTGRGVHELGLSSIVGRNEVIDTNAQWAALFERGTTLKSFLVVDLCNPRFFNASRVYVLRDRVISK